MTKMQLAYLAGAMDSDGYFTIKRNTYAVRVRKDSSNPSYAERAGIKQTNPKIVDLIHAHYGGCRNIQKPNTPNGKPLHAVTLTHLKCHVFVKDLLPYLLIKKEQAEILLELRKLIGVRTKKHYVIQNSRYNTQIEFKKYSVSDENIAQKEALITRIKSLNDIRTDAKHTPLPWK